LQRSRRGLYRLSLSDALSAHARALEEGGGLAGVASIDLIKSAVERPYSGYYRDMPSKAAALVQSMSGNHGFNDGNKRTTVILTHLLLDKSGRELRPLQRDGPIDVMMEELVLSVVRHDMTFDQLVSWFKSRIGRKSTTWR
jgi:death-on-curing protein